MEATNNSSSPIGRLMPVLIVFLGLIGLYYLYQYLFGIRTGIEYTLVSKTQAANIDPSKPIIITSDKLPTIYEGGEFTVSTWIYITNWSYRSGFNKPILSIGGPNFDTLEIYIGANKPAISVKLQTTTKGAVNSTINSGATRDSLDKATKNSRFNILQTDSGLLDSSSMCDLPEVDLQRWVNLTVSVNGKTVDVYLDGKLARSCVLPDFYKVDAGGYSASLLEYGGFGGQISTTSVYDAALNPEQVYKKYMAGPEPITGIVQWLTSFLTPGVTVTVKQTQ
jgi:hypothetical protein